MNPRTTAQPVPFSFFADLVASIASLSLKRTSKDGPIDKFERWAKVVHTREGGVPPETGVVLFRLLFPDEDVRRRYDLKETRLARMLCDVLGVSKHASRGKALLRWGEWTDGSETRAKTGCLGDEVKEVISATYTDREGPGISIHRVDELLDELASHSGFSQMSQQPFHKRTKPRAQFAILCEMYKGMAPHEAAVLTQIILQDLRPVLHPLPIVNTTLNLLHAGPKTKKCELGLYQAMKSWHMEMPRVYRLCANLDEAARAIERGPPYPTSPTLFKPVAIPKCYKGRSSTDSLNQFLNRSSKVYVETKYDGERMQIHVDLSMDHENQIRIFSKSKRDSTMDRDATLPIIRAAMGLPQVSDHCHALNERLSGPVKPSIRRSVILEAEMVAYSERTHAIDEFWRIRGLIQSTARGVRRQRRMSKSQQRPLTPSRRDSDSTDSDTTGDMCNSQSQEAGYSLKSDGTDEGMRHFLLVFFDILHIEGQDLLDEPYQKRRWKLEEIVHVIEGFTCLAARTCIDLHGEDPFQVLTKRFSQAIAQFEEGLVLKSAEGKYNDPSSPPWVKLKKDYIPGLGDTLDMCVVGAAWDKERARDLGVGTDTLTTFYVAALSERPAARRERPRFQCLFTVSYGLGKKELEQLNFEIKYRGVRAWAARSLDTVPYLVNLGLGIQAPDVLFATPMLFEVYGGGFDKAPGCRYYQLRWPRIKKVWRLEERNWTEGETLESYCKKSYAAVGRDPSKKELDVSVANMWRTEPLSSPPARSFVRRRTAETEWFARLQEDKPLTWPTRSTSPSPVHVKSSCAAADTSVSTKPLHTTTTNVTIKMTATEQQDVSVVSPPKEHSKEPITPSSNKRKRPQFKELSHSPPSKRPKTRVTRESTNLINSTMIPCEKWVSGEVPSPTSPTAHLPTPEVSSPVSPHVKEYDFRSLPLHLLIKDAFLLVYRPIYPIIRRPKGKPALSTLLPAERLLNTLQALLIGCAWSSRRTPVPKGIERGIVFVDTSDWKTVADLIQTLREKQTLKNNSIHAHQSREIFVIGKEYLNYFYSYSGGRTIDGQDVKVDFIWTSE